LWVEKLQINLRAVGSNPMSGVEKKKRLKKRLKKEDSRKKKQKETLLSYTGYYCTNHTIVFSVTG